MFCFKKKFLIARIAPDLSLSYYNKIKSTLPLVLNYSTEIMSAPVEEPVIKKPKYDGRSKKRNWEARRTDKGTGLHREKKPQEEPYVRVKRRKYAILLGYSGVDYFGMQRNPEMKTIEEDLFTALLKANLITQEAFDQIQTVGYQRAARTDKGVSAARQVVSIKLPEEVNIADINSNLCNAIRVFAIKRVTKGFNSKSNCDARTYTYMLPTIAFAKSGSEDISQESFRLSEEAHKEINQLLNGFTGTKNFHNFTCKKNPNDPSAKRYIVSFECEPPIVRKGVEFAVMKVKGQSFMLHQIRKMVGLTLAIIKGFTAPEMMAKAWMNEKINIPKAPGLGLVLDQVHYERYNYRYGEDGIHNPLVWTEVDSEVDEFKEKHIYPTIIDTEICEKSMLSWLEGRLSTHNFDIVDADNRDDDEEDNSDDELETENKDCKYRKSKIENIDKLHTESENCKEAEIKINSIDESHVENEYCKDTKSKIDNIENRM